MKTSFLIGNLSGALIACLVLWPRGGETKREAPSADSGKPAKQRSWAGSYRPHADLQDSSPESAAAKYHSRSLVGVWAYTLCQRGNGPTDLHVVQINEDGTFHQLDIETVLDRSKETEDEEHYIPTGVELAGHETGTIDLATGEQSGTKTATEGGVTWDVVDGILHWEMDMGGMGGQGLDFHRIE